MNAFSSETLKFKIKKGPQGFGIALSGGAKTPNPITRETGIVISDVLHGPAFGQLIVGDIILSINGIDMTKAEKPQATNILKGISEALFAVRRRTPVRPGMEDPYQMNMYPGQMAPMSQMAHPAPGSMRLPPPSVHSQMQPMPVQYVPEDVDQRRAAMAEIITSDEAANQLNSRTFRERSESVEFNDSRKSYGSSERDERRDYGKSGKKKSRSRRSPSYSQSSSDEHSRGESKRRNHKRRSSSRGSSIEKELSQIKISDNYAIIPVKAHDPRQVTLRKTGKQNSFGMKLGTRVFVQDVTSGGLADSEEINENDLILSINGKPTDSLTIPEVLKLIGGIDTVILEVQQIDGGTVTLPSTVLDNQKNTKRSSPARRESSSSRKHKSSSGGGHRGSSRDRHSRDNRDRHHQSSSHHRERAQQHYHRDRRSSDDNYEKFHEAVINQKSTHV